jgi:hypothetical protein
MQDTTRLVFVYNADSGLFNTLADIAHKAFSPATYACSLCAVTHDLLSEKHEWRDFVATLQTPCDFLHRDEFIERFGNVHREFPAVFIAGVDGLRCVLDAQALRAMSLVQLKQAVAALASQVAGTR